MKPHITLMREGPARGWYRCMAEGGFAEFGRTPAGAYERWDRVKTWPTLRQRLREAREYIEARKIAYVGPARQGMGATKIIPHLAVQRRNPPFGEETPADARARYEAWARKHRLDPSEFPSKPRDISPQSPCVDPDGGNSF